MHYEIHVTHVPNHYPYNRIVSHVVFVVPMVQYAFWICALPSFVLLLVDLLLFW